MFRLVRQLSASMVQLSLFMVLLLCTLFQGKAQVSAPNLVFPQTGFVTEDTTLALCWDTVSGASSYEVDVASDAGFINIITNQAGIAADSLAVSLNIGQKIYWRVRSEVGGNNSAWSVTRSFRTFHPNSLSGLEMWLRSDSGIVLNGGAVETWTNLANSNDATQATASLRPVMATSGLNGLPTVRFDGADDFLSFTEINNLRTAFLFMQEDSDVNSSQRRPILGHTSKFNFHRSTTGEIYGNSVNAKVKNGTTRLNSVDIDGQVTIMPNDLSLITVLTTANVEVENLSQDQGFSTRVWDGNISEVVLFNTALSDSLRNLCEDYIRFKYAPPINLGRALVIPYGFCDTVIQADTNYASYLWSTGETTSKATVTGAGTYTVTATDHLGYTSVDSMVVHYPEIASLDQPTLCLGGTTAWRTGLDAAVYSFLWSDGSTADTLAIAQAGTYTVTVTDTNGCFSVSNPVQVQIDSFANNISLGPDIMVCSGELIGLTQGAGLVNDYLWSTMDTTSMLVITSTGSYAVTVTNAIGCEGRDTITVTVQGVSPIVGFAAPDTCLGDSTAFVDTSFAVQPTDFISTRSWSFGDGASSSLAAPIHLYGDTGAYQVKLVATTDFGCTDSITKTVQVFGNPVAQFAVDLACTAAPYQFTDSSSALPGDVLQSWAWDFGDMNSSSDQNPNHQYSSAQTYTVKLTVTNQHSCSAIDSQQIDVVSTAAAPTTFTGIAPVSQAVLLENTPVNFSWNNSSGAVSYGLEVSDDAAFTNLLIDTNAVAGTALTTAGFAIDQYYWRAKAFNVCGDSIYSAARPFSIPDLAQINGMGLWLRPDFGVTQSGGLVTDWNDASTNANNASQTDVSKQPTFISNQVNGFGAIAFDGTDDFLEFMELDGIRSIFMVLREDSTVAAGTRRPILGHNTSFNFLRSNSKQLYETSVNANVSNGTTRLNSDTIDGKTTLLPNDYFLLEVFTAGPVEAENLSRDQGFTSRVWDGEFVEVMLIEDVLSATDRTAIRHYLQTKYSKVLNLGPDLVLDYGYCDTSITASSEFSSYLWSTGSTAQSITVSQSGDYALTVTDRFGFSSTDTIRVQFQDITTPNDTALCLGDSLIFVAYPGPGYTYLWQDNSTDSAFTINQPGLYGVVVTDSFGCVSYSDSLVIAIDTFANRVSLGPDQTFCAGDAIGLVSGQDSAVSYLWSTGDTDSILIINTTADYGLTVSNAQGCQGEDTVNITILGINPIVGFLAPDTCLGDSTQFTDTSSAVSAMDFISSWDWTFGDGNNSTLTNPAHLYADTGIYQVKLVVATNFGCSDSLSKTVQVFGNPTAQFTAEQACIALPFAFSDSSTALPGDVIQSWAWNFDDLNSSALQNPTNTFAAVGNYSVTLTVTNQHGCSAIDSQLVEVVSTAPAPAAFTGIAPVHQAVFLENAPVNFSWNNSQGAVRYGLEVSNDAAFTNLLVDTNSLMGNALTTTGYSVNKYYWRAKAFNICGDSTFAQVRQFEVPDLAQINGLGLWLKPDFGVMQSGGFVTDWNDASSGANNASQVDASKQPTFIGNQVNGYGAVAFDGTDDFLAFTELDSIRSIFMLLREDSNAAAGTRRPILGHSSSFDFLRSNSQQLFETTINSDVANGTTRLNSDTIDGTTTLLPNDYFLLELFTAGPVEAENLSQDQGFTSRVWDGEYVEMLLIEDSISDADRQLIRGYLQAKYSTVLNLGPDIVIDYGYCDTSITASSNFSSYLWSTGSTAQNITVTESGIYSLTVTDRFGLSSSDSILVQFPDAVAPADTILCLGDSLGFVAYRGVGYTYLWQDGSSDSALTASAVGQYYVAVTDSFGCTFFSDTLDIAIDSFVNTVSLGPDQSFCAGDFIALVQGQDSAVGYLWSTSSIDSSITISTSGDYEVTVTNGQGCQGFDTININILGINPIMGFIDPDTCFGDSTQFVDTSSAVSVSDFINGWSWTFGDGASSSLTNPTHLYGDTGVYQVKLVVTTDFGCSDSVSKAVSVFGNPTAQFTADQACIALPFVFSDSSTALPGDVIQGWAWDFDDMNTSALQNPTNTFAAVGNYWVKLTVTNQHGCSAIDSQLVEVVSTAPAPGAFTTIAPMDQAVFGPNTPVDFEWNPSIGAVRYGLEVSTDLGFSTFVVDTNTVLQTTLTTPGYSIDGFFWRAKAFNICGDSTYSNFQEFDVPDLALLDDFGLWLKPDFGVQQSSGLITDWQDASGTSNDAVQADSTKRPTLLPNQVNGFPAVAFDGIDDFLEFNELDSIRTVFMITREDSTVAPGVRRPVLGNDTTFNFLRSTSKELWGSSVSPNISNGTTRMNSSVVDGKLALLPNDYFLLEVFTAGPVEAENLSRDQGFTNRVWDGEVLELLLFEDTLSTADENTIRNYLQHKYSETVNLGQDINIAYGYCDTTLTVDNQFSNYNWSTGANTQSITITETGMYAVTVTDRFGFSSSDSVEVNFPVLPQPFSDTLLCAGDTVDWNARVGNGYTYLWQDNSTDTLFQVFAAGIYAVTVSDTNGCSKVSDTIFASINNYPNTTVLGQDSGVCSGYRLSLETGVSATVSYLWSTSSVIDFAEVNSSGQYWVQTTDTIGCVATDTINLTVVSQPPSIDFSMSGRCFSNPTTFADETQPLFNDPLVSWTWTFGDGSTSNLQNPLYVFPDTGFYDVELTVVSDSGCLSILENTIFINALPEVSFTSSFACTNLSWMGINQSSSVHGDIQENAWNILHLGSGNTNSLFADFPNFNFDTAGTYQVILTVTSDSNCSASDTQLLAVSESPVVDFSANNACLGLPSTFVDNYSGSNFNWAWTFGDFFSSDVDDPVHTYADTGMYEVFLQLTNSVTGCFDTVRKEVVVLPKPVAFFADSLICSEQEFQLTDGSTYFGADSITNWSWQVFNGDVKTEASPIFTFQDTGIISLTLDVTTVEGCTDFFNRIVRLLPKPEPDFEFTPRFGIPPIDVELENNTAFAENYSWDFGNGDEATGFEPAYTYQQEGDFFIKLVASNSIGCADSIEKQIRVRDPLIDLAVNDLQVEADGNFMIINTQVINQGTIPITTFDLLAEVTGRPAVREVWNGELPVGGAINYTFTAEIGLVDGLLPEVVCVRTANPEGLEDEVPENNEQCESNAGLVLSPVFPNPVSDVLTIEYVLPRRGQTAVLLYDKLGREIVTLLDEEQEEGFHRMQVRTDQLQSSAYTIRLIFENEQKATRFVKN